MRAFSPTELQNFLSSPIGKKIDQTSVERWSASLWNYLRSQKREVPSSNDDRESFVMMYPPPNITGNLHLGHAITAALQDALVRHRKMSGKNTSWIPGFDHAGLATQAIVERQLWIRDKLTRKEVDRGKLIELANKWKDLKRAEMKEQLNRLGLELDWDREYFTMDERSSLAVQEAFKILFDSKLIYRENKPVFWSKEQGTTLSDIEVENDNGVNKYFRTGEIVEKRPIPQWFINAKLMAHQAVEVIQNGSIDIIPPNYVHTWSSWLIKNGVHDWCISRQSWWGHRIPAYKLDSSPDIQKSWVIAESIEEAQEKLGSSSKVVQDPDVLDTWFSSSLLPLTVSGWPDPLEFSKSLENRTFPLHIMETGFDILNYWVSKMTMVSLTLTGQVPFNLVLLHGMICDSEGKKMSKSKGNVIDPLDVIDGASLEVLRKRSAELTSQGLIEDHQLPNALKVQTKLFPKGIPQCGADGLRAYLLSHDIQEEVVRVQINQIDKVRRLSNKIWNVYRFVIQQISSTENLDQLDIEGGLEKFDETKLDDDDKRVLQQLELCVTEAESSFQRHFSLHLTFSKVELFWTVHLSSKYLESCKPFLFSQKGTKEERDLKLRVIISCLITSTKILHPFMPHLTEYLYQKLIRHIFGHTSDQERIEDIKLLSERPFPKVSNIEQSLLHEDE